jgi:glycosyltransferase involved in cell wall biosynthesis
MGKEVLQAAMAAGLRVAERMIFLPGEQSLLQMLEGVQEVDMVHLRSPIDPASRRVLFRRAAAVLANSTHEPFGLVGLVTMAVGGVACTGATGEDYVVPGHNALVLETTDPQEFVGLFGELRGNPTQEQAMRRAGRLTAERYAWPHIVQQLLLPRLRLLASVAPSQSASRAQPCSQAA